MKKTNEKTPVSDVMLAEYLPAYRRRQDARFENGRREYGDASFDLPVLRLIDEVQQECEDAANWQFMAWSRLEALKETIDAIGRIIPEQCPNHPGASIDRPPKRLCERCWFNWVIRKVQRDVMGVT